MPHLSVLVLEGEWHSLVVPPLPLKNHKQSTRVQYGMKDRIPVVLAI